MTDQILDLCSFQDYMKFQYIRQLVVVRMPTVLTHYR